LEPRKAHFGRVAVATGNPSGPIAAGAPPQAAKPKAIELKKKERRCMSVPLRISCWHTRLGASFQTHISVKQPNLLHFARESGNFAIFTRLGGGNLA